MQFTIEAPDGTTTTETRSVSYYDQDEGTVYSIKRKEELARVAERLIPEGYATYNVYVAGDVQRQHDHPYGAKPEAWIIRDEVGCGKAKVWAAPMQEDQRARAARFRLHLPEEETEFRDWLQSQLRESAAAWGGPEELKGIRFEEYFEPYLSDGFLFNSAGHHEVTDTPGPSNVIVRADEKARKVYQVVRDGLLEAA